MSAKEDQLLAQIELAKCMHNVAVSERNLAQARYDTLTSKLRLLIIHWEEEIVLRKSTKQPEQAALLRECIKALSLLLKL